MRLLIRSQTFLMAALLVVFGGIAEAQEKTDKLPIPDLTARTEALKLVTELYRGEYKKAKSLEQKRALARILFQEAIDTKDDPAGQYVLFRLAKNIASGGNDVRMAMQAIDAMDRRFQINALKMKSDALAKLGAKLGSSAETSDEHFAVAQTGKDLLDKALAEDQFELAAAIGETALKAARKARNPPFPILKEIVARNKEVKEFETAYNEAKTAMAILENKPADPEANLTVGKYQSFYKGQWNKGLTMLALGSDLALKTLARKELQQPTGANSSVDQEAPSLGPTSANAQAQLADGWWTTSENKADAPKKQIQLRAAYWYQKALPNLSGLAKMKASKRLEEIEKRYGEALAQTTGTPTTRGSRQQLLEALGTLSAAQLYQTYLSITLVANGQSQGNFSAEEAKQMLTITESLIQSVDEQLEKAGKLDLDKEDRDSIAQLRKLGKMLRSQSKLLQASWNTRNKAAADRSYQLYLQSHNESWRAIQKLLGL